MSWQAKHEKTIELPTTVLSVAPSHREGHLLAACLDSHVYSVEVESGKYASIGQHQSYASGVVCPDPKEPLGVSAGYDGALHWWDLDSRKEIRRVEAHDFWSWQLAASADGTRVASVSGQYFCNGWKYEPKPAEHPTVKVYDVSTGDLVQAFEHVPPVLSVTFSRDGALLAAGNLMGEVKVWDIASGKELATWGTPNFTGWGIIKGHYYTGGIYSLKFSPKGDEVVCAGMGSTTDPAAGNGRQLWQRFAWKESPVRKSAETKKSGKGLMETLEFSPHGQFFVMGGRVAQGDWNAAFFDSKTGDVLASLSTKTRVTDSLFSEDGRTLYLSGGVSQGKPKDGKFRRFGRVGVYSLPSESRRF